MKEVSICIWSVLSCGWLLVVSCLLLLLIFGYVFFFPLCYGEVYGVGIVYGTVHVVLGLYHLTYPCCC